MFLAYNRMKGGFSVRKRNEKRKTMPKRNNEIKKMYAMFESSSTTEMCLHAGLFSQLKKYAYVERVSSTEK